LHFAQNRIHHDQQANRFEYVSTHLDVCCFDKTYQSVPKHQQTVPFREPGLY
jgi:hypothetical protein